jgi:argininosuccinate lyase
MRTTSRADVALTLVQKDLQWGGRFGAPPDAALLAFGSSLEEDLVLAPFDVRGSRAHVAVLHAARVIDDAEARALDDALAVVETEIGDGRFAAYARATAAEDVHGAIDARVREIAGAAGDRLHAGRSRNDQVATALALYVRDRAERGQAIAHGAALSAIAKAREELAAGSLVAATTHWQPAQPVLLAFWLGAVAETLGRAAQRFARVRDDASVACPLGAAACCGTGLPLDRSLSAQLLGFAGPSRNALDTVGDRDLALDLLHATARALAGASRVSEELVLWCTPAFGYARLDDAASTGSSIMPQKRNPDPFELVRGAAAAANGAFAGALASTTGLALSYHRDLQETKALVLRGTERGLAALAAFARAFDYVRFDRERTTAHAGDGYAIATDLGDALIASGIDARKAHSLVGARVLAAERAGRPLDRSDLDALREAAAAAGGGAQFDAPLDPEASVRAKRTSGSTHPDEVAKSLDALEAVLA